MAGTKFILRASAALMALAIPLMTHAAEPPAKPQIINGTFALTNTAPRSTAILRAVPLSDVAEGLDFSFKSNNALTVFEPSMGKQLHVIAISDDFHLFHHAHVETADNGHFRLRLEVPRSGMYYVYADATPKSLGHQVFRFNVPVGVAMKDMPLPKLSESALNVREGSYLVRLDPVHIVAGQQAALHLHIDQNGKPATDLQPYLGVAAHAVFISGDTLSYTHAHAMLPDAKTQNVSPDLTVDVTLPARGLYKFWLQFDGNGQVETVPFVVPVS